ncbi:hypothetical protein OK016_07555 [Vibrio chagasii]|nr:hypothetical protein [Vibrio chagasii]
MCIDEVPRSETIALGAGSLTPMKVAQGYFSVFANGGYYVEPFYISRIETPFGETEFETLLKLSAKKIANKSNHHHHRSMADEFAEQDVDAAKVQYAPRS